MPASLVLKKYAAGKLHSGSKHGPVVTNPHQARAIQISEARSEGYNIPLPKKAAHKIMKARSKKRGY